MRIRTALADRSDTEESLAALVAAEPYLTYAGFAPIARREGGAAALHLKQWREAAAGQEVVVARGAGGRPLAALRFGRKEFESDHFGLAMARLDAPIAVAEAGSRQEVLRALYAAAFEELRGRGFQHVAAVASTHDRVASWLLQEAGCFYVGARISWMQPLTGVRSDEEIAPALRIETYEKEQIPDLPRSSWQRLYDWTGRAFDRGPYVFDLTVPHEKSLQTYQVWTYKALTGEWADVLLVVRDGDEVVAYHTMMVLEDLSAAAGVRIVGRGIGGTLPGYRGLFTALQRECSATRPLGAGFLENETQVSTIPSINVFGKLGHLCQHSTASFHMRLDGGAAPRAQKPTAG